MDDPGASASGAATIETPWPPPGMSRLGEILVREGIVTAAALSNALAAQSAGSEWRLGRLLVLQASTEREIASIFATLSRERIGALVVQNDPFFDSQRNQLVALAARNAIPAIYHIREFPAAGGLMSYGADLRDSYRQAGIYTARVLKGAQPGELPIQQSNKVELIINLRTAKALGVTIPSSLLARADEVIE
jgi:putative ABC transport system substrate-binding protein